MCIGNVLTNRGILPHTKHIFENYSMLMLSIRGNYFIAHWAYEETISSHTEHTPNEFSCMLSQRKNVKSFYLYIYAEHTGKWFYRTLSIRGNDLNTGWAYVEMISSLTEHTRKCLKVEYHGRIEYDFQKSRVTGPWDHKDSVSAKMSTKKIPACVPLSGKILGGLGFLQWWPWLHHVIMPACL